MPCNWVCNECTGDWEPVVSPGGGCDTGPTQDCYCRGYPGAGAGGCTYNAELCDPPPSTSPSPKGPEVPKLENQTPKKVTTVSCGGGKPMTAEEKKLADMFGEVSMSGTSRVACAKTTLSDWDEKLVDWGVRQAIGAPAPVEGMDCVCTCSGCPPPVL